MQKFKEYLKNTQHMVYESLIHAFLKKKTTHAYLISGTIGSPVLELAEFMAQSFVCSNKDENHMACEECDECNKIKNNSYIDYIFYKGEDLKRDNVDNIQREFNKSAVEKANIKVYVIHLIEKAPISSLNKLLKFLEEPSSDIIAIFTTYSMMSVLPTIVSRCQIINLRQFSQKELINAMLEVNADFEDAKLLAVISNDLEKNVKLVKSEEYKTAKEITKNCLNYMLTKPDYLIFYMLNQGLARLEEIKQFDLYLDMLQACFFAVMYYKASKEESYFFKDEIEKIATSNIDIYGCIMAILTAKQEMISNANKSLVYDKLFICLAGGDNSGKRSS